MEKSRLAKIVGVGLLGIFCLPAIAQAQGGLVKAGSKAVSKTGFSAACKEAGCPLVKVLEESAGKINKAVVKASQTGKIAAEVAKPGVSGSSVVVNGASVNLPKRASEQINNLVGTGTRPTIAPATGKKFQPNPTKYYSMANNAEEIPTLVQKVEPQIGKKVVQPAGEVETKAFQYQPGSPIGLHYQKELQYDIWKGMTLEANTVCRGCFNWRNFPETLAEQEAYVNNFIAGQKEEIKELFNYSEFDITTQAQIAYTAQEWNKLTFKDLFSNANVDVVRFFSSANRKVDIGMLFYRASVKTSDWIYALQKTYRVDRYMREIVESAARENRLTLPQLEELLQSIDLRREVIWQTEEAVLVKKINDKAEEIANAFQKQLDIANSVVNKETALPLQQVGQLKEVIVKGHLNAEQATSIYEKTVAALMDGDSTGEKIHDLWQILRENQAKGITLSAQEVLEEADRIFRY